MKYYNINDERCIPPDILYYYKMNKIYDKSQIIDIKDHLSKCKVCSERSNNIEEEFNEMISIKVNRKKIKIPEQFKKIDKNVKIKTYKSQKPKRGDIWIARGKEYFWQPSKIVVIINYIAEEDVYYVVPLNEIYIYGTDLDVILKSKKKDVYIAETTNDYFLFRNQLSRKVDEVYQKTLEDIRKMVLYIAGKDIDISKVPKGLAILSEKDQRIKEINIRNKVIEQLYEPYRVYLAQEEMNTVRSDSKSTEKENNKEMLILQEAPTFRIQQPSYGFSMGAISEEIIQYDTIHNLKNQFKETTDLLKQNDSYIGLQWRKDKLYVIYSGVDLIEYFKDGKWISFKNRKGDFELGGARDIDNIVLHYKTKSLDEKRRIKLA